VPLWFRLTVGKDGYLASSTDRFGFEYAGFWEDSFYQPNASEPVLFHLKNLKQ